MHAFSKRPSTRHPISSCHLRAILSLSIVRVRRKKIFRAAYKFLNFCRALLTVTISEMADKEKRLRKILVKKCLKGKLKLVDTLEQSHFVLVNRKRPSELLFLRKEGYLKLIERGYTFPEEEVYFSFFQP